jgi:hypothetical protein
MDDDDDHEHDDAGVESGLMASLRPSRSFLPAVTTFSSRASARLSGRSGRFVLGLVLLLLLVLAFVAWSAHTEPDESEHHMVQGQPGSGGTHALLSQMQVEAESVKHSTHSRRPTQTRTHQDPTIPFVGDHRLTTPCLAHRHFALMSTV